MIGNIVYLAAREDRPSWLKVGFTSNITMRTRTLSMAHKTKVTCLHHETVSFAQRVERAMHFMLRDLHREGEWFETSLDEALKVLELAKELTASDLHEMRLAERKVSVATMVLPFWKREIAERAGADGISTAAWLERLLAKELGLEYDPRPKWRQQLKF